MLTANFIIPSNVCAPKRINGKFCAFAYVDGKTTYVPVNELSGVLNGKKTEVTEKYADKLCVYTVDENGYYYLRCLSDSYDENGTYNGLETEDTSVLLSDDENDMFVAQNAEVIADVQRVDGVNLYLGSRENIDSAKMTELSKVIVRTYFTQTDTYEWVTYDYNAIKYMELSNSGWSNLGHNIPTETVSYVVSNDVSDDDSENIVVAFITNTYVDDNEYNIESFSASKPYPVTRADVSYTDDGHIVLDSQYDSYIRFDNINIDTSLYKKIRIRMKAEYDGTAGADFSQIFFMREQDSNFSDSRVRKIPYCYNKGVDSEGWDILDIDLEGFSKWNGIVKSLRFDPNDLAGKYTIDYIRFIKNGTYEAMSDSELEALYTPTRLLADENFENGFDVRPIINNYDEEGHFEYLGSGDDSNNVWAICPWWTHNCDGLKPAYATNSIIKNRDYTTDQYTITDNNEDPSVKVVYSPNRGEGASVSMTLNCSNIYKGTPHINDDASTPYVNESNRTWWPHLLLEQDPTIYEVDKKVNTAAADRVICELDVRMPSYTETTNTEGVNVCQYLVYFYLFSDKLPNKRIWFGLALYDSNGGVAEVPTWHPDSAANQMIYCVPQETVYGGIDNSFIRIGSNGNGGNTFTTVPSNEWKTLRIDMTPHIDRAVEWSNRDNVFGKTVTKEDFYFGGVNIGFETHGNIDCTFEIRNFNLVSYSD